METTVSCWSMEPVKSYTGEVEPIDKTVCCVNLLVSESFQNLGGSNFRVAIRGILLFQVHIRCPLFFETLIWS